MDALTIQRKAEVLANMDVQVRFESPPPYERGTMHHEFYLDRLTNWIQWLNAERSDSSEFESISSNMRTAQNGMDVK